MTLGLEYLDSLLEEDKEKGIFRCKRDMFTDQRLFDLEMKHIFEGNWLYLAHESQLPNVNDYLTTVMGRTPIFIARNKRMDNSMHSSTRVATVARSCAVTSPATNPLFEKFSSDSEARTA